MPRVVEALSTACDSIESLRRRNAELERQNAPMRAALQRIYNMVLQRNPLWEFKVAGECETVLEQTQ